MRKMKIKDVTIDGSRTYVVAEMAWSHDGSKDLALKIVRDAAEAGADCISVHITNVEAYMAPHYGSGKGRVSAGKEDRRIFEYLESINIRDQWWPDIFSEARSLGLAVAAMPNDEPSLDLAKQLEPDAYVIHAASFTEEPLLRAVAGEGKPMLLRVGGATLGEIENALGMIRQEGCEQFVLLHGQQNYPTKIEDTDLRKLRTLRQVFQCPVGLADHIDAEDPLATRVPLMAVALDAWVIEKHLTHDRQAKGEDHESALNGHELAEMIESLRGAEAAMGQSAFECLSESQRQYRLVSRKKVVAARDLPAGHELAGEDLVCKRSDAGAWPEQLDLLIGRQVRRDLVKDEGVTLEDVG